MSMQRLVSNSSARYSLDSYDPVIPSPSYYLFSLGRSSLRQQAVMNRGKNEA